VLLTRKARLRRIRLTQKARLQRIRLTRKTRLCKTSGGTRNWKKEKVLLQAKGQLYGGAQGVLPRQKMQIAKEALKRVG
jgi:hypothetical protein